MNCCAAHRFLFILTLNLTAVLYVQAEPSAADSRAVRIGLDEAVRRALQDNLGLAIERIQPQVRQTTVDEARAVFDPTSNASVQYSETSSPRSSEQQAADGRASTGSRQFEAEAGVSQRLSTGAEVGLTGRTRNTQSTFNQFADEFNTFAGLTFRHPLLRNVGTANQLFLIRSARKQLEADRATLQFEVSDLIRRVHFAYYELLFSLANHQAIIKSLTTAERLMVDNQNRYELGVMTPLDVAQARSEVAQRMSALLQAELDIQTNETELKRLVFRDLAAHLDDRLMPSESFVAPESLPSSEVNIAEGLASRPDLRALVVQAERNGLELRYRKNQLYPELDLTGRVGLQGRDGEFGTTVRNIIETRDEQWGVGLSVSIPWGMNGEQARLERSRLEGDRLLLEIKNKENEIIQQISNTHRAAENARLRYSNDRRAREISERTAEAEEEKLVEGISTSFTVLQLQRDAVLARNRELRSLVEYYRSLVELRHFQGLLAREHGLVSESASGGL